MANSIDGAQPKEYKIAQIIRAQGFNRSKKEYNIALIKLEEEVIFTASIRPACLQSNLEFGKVVVAVIKSFLIWM